jgi:membrane protein DedA with SNARE-associated domain
VLGAIAWASTVGTLAYVLGRSASGSIGAIGFAGVGIAVLVYLAGRIRGRLRQPEAPSAPTADSI